MMPQDPDLSEAYWQGHFVSKEMASAYAKDIEKLAGLQGHQIPRAEVTKDPQGGWNVWVWE